MPKSTVIPALKEEARLKRGLRKHLASLGFARTTSGELAPPSHAKDVVRGLHKAQRDQRIKKEAKLIESQKQDLEKCLANGSDIDPQKIQLVLRKVDAATTESNLFRIASFYWSVPVSAGFGRRLRYLVWDAYHDRLAGLVALGDPVFNLGVRDKLIGWSSKDRCSRLTNMLDAYILGALPPYNFLLGGKVIACLVKSRDVYDDFAAKYGASRGIISGRLKKPRLLAVTTSSSLGRSSVYNRLSLNNEKFFEPIGYTEGWGHFHIPDDLFESFRDYLRRVDHPYVAANRFGQGPNWKLRVIREALKALDLPEDLLRHGVKREVFMAQLSMNSLAILRGQATRPKVQLSTVAEISRAGVDRWMVPRAERRPEFRYWIRSSLIASLTPGSDSQQLEFANADSANI